jgi:DNA polymerase ligase (LigD)-like protein
VPRFVVLYHDTPPGHDRPSHFDLMLEAGSALLTFALPRWPAEDEAIACEQLADHRLAYLDYEGPIAGGRGAVTRHESGDYDIEAETSEMIVLRLYGQRLAGTLTLKRLSAESPKWQATWQAKRA